MQYVKGRVGGVANGLDIDLSLENGVWTGHFGGRVGSDLRLEVEGAQARGRVGGAHKGFDVNATLVPERVVARLGGLVGGDNLELDVGGRVHGRFSGAVLGKDVNLEAEGNALTGIRLHGRIGGALDGKDVLVATNYSSGLAALAAVIAFKLLEDGPNQA
jgi:hypothetical protein